MKACVWLGVVGWIWSCISLGNGVNAQNQRFQLETHQVFLEGQRNVAGKSESESKYPTKRIIRMHTETFQIPSVLNSEMVLDYLNNRVLTRVEAPRSMLHAFVSNCTMSLDHLLRWEDLFNEDGKIRYEECPADLRNDGGHFRVRFEAYLMELFQGLQSDHWIEATAEIEVQSDLDGVAPYKSTWAVLMDSIVLGQDPKTFLVLHPDRRLVFTASEANVMARSPSMMKCQVLMSRIHAVARGGGGETTLDVQADRIKYVLVHYVNVMLGERGNYEQRGDHLILRRHSTPIFLKPPSRSACLSITKTMQESFPLTRTSQMSVEQP